jgi:hypothetical protein
MVPPFFCFSTQLTTSIDVSSSAVLHSIMPPMAGWSQSARYSGLYHYMLLANSEMRLQVASTGEKSRFWPHPRRSSEYLGPVVDFANSIVLWRHPDDGRF